MFVHLSTWYHKNQCKLDIQMTQHESCKPIYFGVKKVKVTVTKKQCRRGSLHSCECWILLVSLSFSLLFPKEHTNEYVSTSMKCIKPDLSCSFADKCTKFCTISCKLFNATISDEMTPWYTDVLQVIATSANNTMLTAYKLHSPRHNLSS